MSPQVPYGGPTALGFSIHASPHMKKAQLSIPPTVSSVRSGPTHNTIATKEQIVASHNDAALEVSHNSDAELAIASGNALKEQVDQHAARFSRTVSTAVTNIRKLLELIREAVKKDDESALKTVDGLWAELEQLFEAANGAKDALPEFLEKQRSNMALYHRSAMNETYRETQEELNMQHRKVNLQHGLILEHQQVYQDFKASTAAKLNELDDLRERVSRLTLEKGNFKDEIDKYAQLLEKEQSIKGENLKKAEALQKELEALTTSKTQLIAEVEGLQKTTSDLQEKMHAAEQQTTDQFTTQLKAKTDQLTEQTAKTTNLNTLLSTLKGRESDAKMEIGKLRAENKLANEKYHRLAAEHAEAFSRSKEQIQKSDALANDTLRLREDNASLKKHLTKLPELERNIASLFQDKSDLLEQVGKLTIELNQAKENGVRLDKELITLTEGLQEVLSQKEGLEIENNVLLSRQKKLEGDAKKAVQAFTNSETENTQLKDFVNKFKANSSEAVLTVDGPRLSSSTGQNMVVLEQKTQELENQNKDLRKALEEWTALAKRSYKEYKEMLPVYKQAEKLQKAALEKEEQIKNLKLELNSNKSSSKPGGIGAGGDAPFWKAKYENLMARVSN